MPRPEIKPELLAEWEAELDAAEANPAPGMKHIYSNPLVRNKLREVALSGKWLEIQLREAGCDDEKIGKYCFSFGQRCMMAPDVWELAKKTVVIYQTQGNVPAPATHVTRDLPDEEKKQLFEEFTKVHPE